VFQKKTGWQLDQAEERVKEGSEVKRADRKSTLLISHEQKEESKNLS